MTIWEKLAQEWRIHIPTINREEDIVSNLNIVKEMIGKGITVPSTMDEIYADDEEDEDEDW
ncbi:hypothetical protein [Bacillus infantis]|uniref:hypothetical protein n=1 Tax=Bacillus infantis TaxID=324767 RepID=UPI0020A12E21|nr:hypothetical protein [Bacillus infantis]MCP1157014.1 hypothetical protein [Bacillus infantis]